MVDSVSQARQWFSLHRITAAFIVVVCLAGPVAGATGGPASSGLSTGANPGSIGPTESGVHAQTGPLVAANGSVTINETRTNRTQVVLDSVTLPQNGYIVAQTGNVSANQSGGTVVGHTQYVRNGTFENVVLELNETVGKSKVSVALYNDSNGDETLNITGNGTTDAPYRSPNGTPIRDSVQIGANSTENATATVTLSNQTTNGSRVRVKSATLPNGGFVVLTNDPYSEIGLLEESIIAVSKPLSPGTHHNITLRVRRSPPGGYINRTTLDTTSDYAVGLHRDTNNNSRFEYITSSGTNDTAYLTGSGTERRYASNAATITIPGSNTPTPSASIRFRNQTTNGSTVTVDSVTLPSGGFVAVHNESYLRGGDPLQTIVGRSRYLSSGTHRNVSVPLSHPVQQSQTLVAIPSRDTNGNQRYDYVRSEGFQDPAYTGNGKIITDPASVTISGSSPASEASSSTPMTPAAGSSHTPSTAPSTQAREAARDRSGGIDWLSVQTPVALGLVLIGGYLLVRIRR
jgi:hypothetical protein